MIDRPCLPQTSCAAPAAMMSSTISSTMSSTATAPPSPSQSEPLPPDPHRTAEAKAAFTAHLTAIGNSHISALESRVSDIHSNSRAISKQEDDLAKSTKKLAEESRKHQKVADDAAGKLKELGDIQNWAEVLERDLLVLEETMRMGEGEESGWETEEEICEEDGRGSTAPLVNEDDKGKAKETITEGVNSLE